MNLSHQQAQEWLQLGLEDNLTPQQRAKLDAHLGECVPCAAYARQLDVLDARLRAELPAACPPRAFSSAELQARKALVRSRFRRMDMKNKGISFVRSLAVVAGLVAMLLGGLWLTRELNRAPQAAEGKTATPEALPQVTPTLPPMTVAETLTVAFYQEDGIYYWQPGMTAQLLEELENSLGMLWINPDGKQVFYVYDDPAYRGLYSVSIPNGESRIWVTNEDLDALDPRGTNFIRHLEWLPGTNTALFDTYQVEPGKPWEERSVNQALFLLKLDVSGEVQTLLPPGEGGFNFSLSPDGKYVVLLHSDRIEGMRVDGTDRKVLFTETGGRLVDVRWKPDSSGFWVLVPPAIDAEENGAKARLYQVGMDGQVAVRTEVDVSFVAYTTLQLSPDGNKLAYIDPALMAWRIRLVDSGEDVTVQFPDGTGDQSFVGWSPDSSQYLLTQGDRLLAGKVGKMPRLLKNYVYSWYIPPKWADASHFIGFTWDKQNLEVISLDGSFEKIGNITRTRPGYYAFTPVVEYLPPPEESTEPAIPGVSDLRVRQAIALCVDRSALLRAAYPWMEDTAALEQDALINRRHWAYPWASQAAPYPYDPAGAGALLDEAGWTLADGQQYRANSAGERLSLRLITSSAASRRTWTPELVAQLQNCGIEVVVEYLDAQAYYAADGPLYTGDFDLALFAQLDYAFYQQAGNNLRYSCIASPSPENLGGMNLSGWCSPAADQALAQAAYSTNPGDSLAAYQWLQNEVSQDLPEIPLFSRWDASAARADLQGFDPQPGELLTWNAAQWAIPGQETVTLGERSEPTSLVDSSYVSQVLRALILGQNGIFVDQRPTPGLLVRLPSLAAEDLQIQAARVQAGDAVVDAYGNVVVLQPGVQFWKVDGSGLATYSGGEVDMLQTTTRFVFTPGLTWSDGLPLTETDFLTGFMAFCEPVGEYPDPQAVCRRIQEIIFDTDTSLKILWRPGYLTIAYLPPFSRLPSHFVPPEGGTLGEHAEEIQTMRLTSLPGSGPYSLESWTYGKEMVLRANPYYAPGASLSAELRIRFIPQEDAAQALIDGTVDVLGMDSILPEQVPALLAAQAEGKLRVILTPSGIYEALVFNLRER